MASVTVLALSSSQQYPSSGDVPALYGVADQRSGQSGGAQQGPENAGAGGVQVSVVHDEFAAERPDR